MGYPSRKLLHSTPGYIIIGIKPGRETPTKARLTSLKTPEATFPAPLKKATPQNKPPGQSKSNQSASSLVDGIIGASDSPDASGIHRIHRHQHSGRGSHVAGSIRHLCPGGRSKRRTAGAPDR